MNQWMFDKVSKYNPPLFYLTGDLTDTSKFLELTCPNGIPRAVFSSSERFPGFFSFSLVSNSFPYLITKIWKSQIINILKDQYASVTNRLKHNIITIINILVSIKHLHHQRNAYKPHNRDPHELSFWVWSATWRKHHGVSGNLCQFYPSLVEPSPSS